MHRKAVNDQKEMKLLLDMYKGVSKEQRDKVQLMAAEKKTRAELEDIRQQLKKMQVQHSPVTQMAVGRM
jgi:E3 ubiquitin-protein ligase BRE1